jgi:hypothetical protein
MEQTITSKLTRPRVYTRSREQELWEVYHSWGRAATGDKLVAYAREKGWFNPRKGEPSRMGPRWAMWRYAFRNPKEAYPHFEKWANEYRVELIENDINISFESFLKEVKEHVKKGNMFREGTIRKWCEKWGVPY